MSYQIVVETCSERVSNLEEQLHFAKTWGGMGWLAFACMVFAMMTWIQRRWVREIDGYKKPGG